MQIKTVWLTLSMVYVNLIKPYFGYECTLGEECGPGARCVDHECAITSNRPRRLLYGSKQYNEECTTYVFGLTDNCLSGLDCVKIGGTQEVCKKAEGSECTTSEECAGNCVGGLCRYGRVYGAYCGDIGKCAWPLKCQEDYCKKGVSMTCHQDDECSHELQCFENRCEYKQYDYVCDPNKD
eukprot:1006704_1